jgi:ATP-dependent Clp protease ATP-binding subunit ClpB
LNLEQEQIGKIVDIQMQHLANRLAEKNIALILSDSARDLIAREGYDPIYGARPLRRVIQRQIENPLAMEILEGNVAEGDRISAETDGGQVIFRKA